MTHKYSSRTAVFLTCICLLFPKQCSVFGAGFQGPLNSTASSEENVPLYPVSLLESGGGRLVQSNLGTCFISLKGSRNKSKIIEEVSRLEDLSHLTWEDVSLTSEELSLLLKNTKSLKSLDLRNTGLSKSCFKIIGNLESLERLSFTNNFYFQGKRHELDSHFFDEIAGLEGLIYLDLSGQSIDTKSLRKLGSLKSLKLVCNLDSEDILSISDLKNLRELTLSIPQHSDDAHIESLAKLINLENLDMGVQGARKNKMLQSSINDVIEKLAANGSKLKNLNGVSIDDETACHLANMSEIESISAHSFLSNEGIEQLATCKKLSNLELSYSTTLISTNRVRENFDWRGLKGLASSKSISSLKIDCPLDNNDLQSLSNFKSLKELDIKISHSCNVGLLELQKLSNLEKLSLQSDGNYGKSTKGNANKELILPPIPRLRHLALYELSLRDNFFSNYNQFKELQTLYLLGANFTDNCWKNMCSIPGLKQLHLTRIELSKGRLEDLVLMPNLMYLEIIHGVSNAELSILGESESLETLFVGERRARMNDILPGILKGSKNNTQICILKGY